MAQVYLELHIRGGGTALIDTTAIIGVMCKGSDTSAPGVPDAPTIVVLRSGDHLEVIGESPAKVIVRAKMARDYAKQAARDIHVDWLTPLDPAQEEELARADPPLT